MNRLVVASHNPVKTGAVRLGFEKMFPGKDFSVTGLSVPSGVKDQPSSEAETLQGAINRAEGARQEAPEADYYIGIEGGIEQQDSDMAAFAWVVVLSANGAIGRGRTGTFFLPSKVADLVRGGKEMGEADDIVFGRTNSKQANGAVGILTGDATTRLTYYAEAVIFALIPFKNNGLY